MEEIKFLTGNHALNLIKKLNIDNMFVHQWYEEKHKLCYVMYVNDTPVSIALLSRCDFDPLKKHTNPKTFNFIFTFEEYRRKGYACTLILHIKKNNQFTAFCGNDISEKLFTKADCSNHGEFAFNVMFRYP